MTGVFSMTTSKEFISPAAMSMDSFRMAKKIYDSGYRPDLMLVLWRGGAPVGMAVHEFFRYKGIELRHVIVKAESYTAIEERKSPRVELTDDVLALVGKNMKVLVVDDILDTGATIRKIRSLLLNRTGNVKVATLYVKKDCCLEPEYFLREVKEWVVFPHEIAGLSPEEIRTKDEDVFKLLEG